MSILTKEEYQEARKALGYNVTDWIKKLGIELDTHKSFNSGRREVNAMVGSHIKTLLNSK
jgi:hypothetical protein